MESTENETIDQKPEADDEVDRLLSITAGAQFFRSIEGHFHARVPVNGRQEILGLRSAVFRDWLVGAYLKEHRKLPCQRSVGRVLQALEASARFDPTTPTVHVRVGFDSADGETVDYLDLADAGGHAVRMCASGWSVVDRPSVHFKRPQGLLPLPVPSRDGSIELLRPFVNLTDSDFLLLIGWMAAALRPAGPYPILVIHGEQGSAKSTLAKVIRQLIDPHDSVFGTFLLERLSYWDAGDSDTKSPAEWLAKFNKYKEHKATTSARWPKTPAMLGNELRRLAPTLREHGVIVTFGKNRKSRLITITLLPGFDDDYSGATP